jgi:hypothetical protein
LIFEWMPWVSQPTFKPPQAISPIFPPRDPPGLRRATSPVGWLGFVSGAAVAVVSAAAAPLEETTIAEKQQRQPAGEGED